MSRQLDAGDKAEDRILEDQHQHRRRCPEPCYQCGKILLYQDAYRKYDPDAHDYDLEHLIHPFHRLVPQSPGLCGNIVQRSYETAHETAGNDDDIDIQGLGQQFRPLRPARIEQRKGHLESNRRNQVEDIDAMVDTNVKGLLYVIKAVVPQMVARKAQGIVVNLGSVAGNTAYAGGAVYCGSKAAVRYISDGLRIDLVDTPIKVTNVEPGLVETEFSIVRYKGDKDKAKKVYTGIDPLTPDDIADTVAYICNMPQNVQIPEIVLTPTHQADAIYKHYEN